MKINISKIGSIVMKISIKNIDIYFCKRKYRYNEIFNSECNKYIYTFYIFPTIKIQQNISGNGKSYQIIKIAWLYWYVKWRRH